MTHFELFGLTASFPLDGAALSAKYRELQAAVHPDRFANASDAEKRAAMEQATQVNDAYQTLKDPVRRAIYLLSLKNIDALDETNTKMPHDFLVQQLEWREALEFAKKCEDIDKMVAMNDELAGIIESLGSTFSATYSGGHLPIATTLARKMRFMQKLCDEVDAALAEAGA
jgi:molecular chaperone HscB